MQRSMNKRMIRILLLLQIILLLITISCGSFMSEKNEAQDLMSDYFECIQADDLTSLEAFYNTDHLLNIVPAIALIVDYGDLQSYKLKSWQVTHNTVKSSGMETSSIIIKLRYRVRYSTAITDEWYRLKKQDTNDTYLIDYVRIKKKTVISALTNLFTRLINRL